MPRKPLTVLVFAHNEEDRLAGCIASLGPAGLGPEDRVVIAANGCTDATPEIAADLARRDPRVALRLIARGDKANAWNDYVHTLAEDDGRSHVFVDGDVTLTPGALNALARALEADPEALAAAGTPRGGRQAPAWGARIVRHHGLPGNLYALSGATVARLKAGRIWLPVGLIGDDVFLLWLLRRDLDGTARTDKRRIVPVAAAGFVYTSFARLSPSGLRALVRRQRTYALRDLQVLLLQRHCQTPGAPLPRRIATLYHRAAPWDQLFAPNGLRPLRLRKLLFVDSWLRTRQRPASSGLPLWDEETEQP